MSQTAPEYPSTEVLHLAHHVDDDTLSKVTDNREQISQILNGEVSGFLDINGGCGSTIEEQKAIIAEAKLLQEKKDPNSTRVMAYRSCVYKPRTNSEDWHGMETTHPEEAYVLQKELASIGIAVAMEVAHPYHTKRYGNLVSFGWTGSRNANSPELLARLGRQDIKLPLGIKNNLDGDIERALEQVDVINSRREAYARKLGISAAPAVLVYRGGENAKTPEAWEDAYIEAYERTDGRLIVDTAHGSEMAHHPEGVFQKSVEGQIAAMDHLVELACRGYAPLGKLSEASSTTGQTDPNMPLAPSLEASKQLHEIKSQDRVAI